MDAAPLNNPVLPGTLTVSDNAYLGGAIGGEGLRVTRQASAVDRIEIIGALAGNVPQIRAAGQSANVSLGFWAKGSGAVIFYAGNAAQMVVQATPGATNFVQMTGAAGGNPTVSTNGGALLLNGYMGTVLSGVGGSIGFYGRAPVARQSLTGSTSDPVLRSLCAALDSLGLIQSTVTAP